MFQVIFQERVIEYCEHRRDDKIDVYDFDDDDNKNSWDENNLENFSSKEQLFDTTLVANYMDIKTLLNLTYRYIADNIRGKTTENIEEYFIFST